MCPHNVLWVSYYYDIGYIFFLIIAYYYYRLMYYVSHTTIM